LILAELRKVIPAFLTRVDVPDRGGAWSDYLAETRSRTAEVTANAVGLLSPEPKPLVTLSEFEKDGELKIVAAAMYAASDLPDDELLTAARALDPDERASILRTYIGDRENRRHRPGRAFERTSYRFDILCDYGAFRDLQRHRMLTLEWQRLSTRHGYEQPAEIEEAGALTDFTQVMQAGAELHDALAAEGLEDAAQYAVPMAYRMRFVMQMSAREAMHLIELRSSPQGHPAYRKVAHEMHRLIRDEAQHRAIADAMTFVDYSDVDLERLEAERRTDAKRRALGAR
jgi:hypothetical protein